MDNAKFPSVVALVLWVCMGLVAGLLPVWANAHPLTILLLCVAGMVLVRAIGGPRLKDAGMMLVCALCFAALVAGSWAVHYWVLGRLPADMHVNLAAAVPATIQQVVTSHAVRYLLFPAAVILNLLLLARLSNLALVPRLVCLLWLPAIVVYLSQTVAILMGGAPAGLWGLSADPSGFGISLFFILPFCAVAAIQTSSMRWRWGYLAFAGALLAAGLLRMQRTTLAGWSVLLLAAPILWFLADGRGRSARIAAGLCRMVAFCFAGLTLAAMLFVLLLARDQMPEVGHAVHEPVVEVLERLRPKEGSDRGRLYFGIPAVRLLFYAPASGWGPGNFLTHMQNIQWVHRDYVPLRHNAANQYLQLGAELGLPAVAIYLLLVSLPVWMVWRVRNRIVARKDRFCALLLACTLTCWLLANITGPHMVNVEVLWPLSCVTAYCATLAMRYQYRCWRPPMPWLIAGGVLLVSAVLAWHTSGGAFGYRRMNERLNLGGGYYALEQHSTESSWLRQVWTGAHARIGMRAVSDFVQLEVSAHTANSSLPAGLEVQVFANGSLIDTIHFFNGGTRTLQYYLPGVAGTDFLLELAVSRTFVPARIGDSTDQRELGVLITYHIRRDVDGTLLLHERPLNPGERVVVRAGKPFPLPLFRKSFSAEGCGFHETEVWTSPPPGWPSNTPLQVRWTGMRASMMIPPQVRDGSRQVCVYAAHPDLAADPLRIEVYADAALMQTMTLGAPGWYPLPCTPEQFAGREIVTLQLSRVWNPLLSGVSADGRDLGVAVAVPPR